MNQLGTNSQINRTRGFEEKIAELRPDVTIIDEQPADSKTDKALRHGAHTSEHLACRHIMPLPSLIILPLCDKIIRILLRTTRQQRIYRVIIRGAVGRLWYKFSQHGSL